MIAIVVSAFSLLTEVTSTNKDSTPSLTLVISPLIMGGIERTVPSASARMGKMPGKVCVNKTFPVLYCVECLRLSIFQYYLKLEMKRTCLLLQNSAREVL